MRTIHKGKEPASLTEYRKGVHATYDGYPDKDTLRAFLVAEQRGLCCYCMSRIRGSREEMKIAHWHSQSRHPDEQLEYWNLLGACKGNERKRRGEQHCDTRQADRDISRNPANPRHRVEQVIRYRGDGRVESEDAAFDKELNEVLNLNFAFLVNNRRAVLTAFQETLRKRGKPPRQKLERWLREWNGESSSDDLRPFCQVVVCWLHKRLRRVS
ncbi:MAG: TIGR02646 family protein [Bryobacterales bacterium]|nr:TIGR02646 family protein [Bryobacterales bacterium]